MDNTPGDSNAPSGKTAASCASGGAEGNDAICFTAGMEGAAFGAGVIHAYLAADRKPPGVAAGISIGAISAAVMQRAYKELQQKRSTTGGTGKSSVDEESARWSFFRRYVQALAEQPLNVLWDAIPDQSDFFADVIPIFDTATPPHFREEEIAARRDRYLLVKLGRWLARLPVTIRQVATLIVDYVRCREKYTLWEKVKSFIGLILTGIAVLTKIILHGVLAPEFFPEHQFMRQAMETDPHGLSGMRRLLRRAQVSLLSWLNVFTLSVVLWGSGLVFVLSLLGASGRQQSDVLRFEIGILVAFALNVVTARFRKWLITRAWMAKYLMPFAGWSFSSANLLLLTVGVVSALAGNWDTVLLSLVLLVALCLLFSPLVILSEPRRWLQDKGFLRRWPRPLLGWAAFLLIAVNVLSLAGYAGFGLFFIRGNISLLWRAPDFKGLLVLVSYLFGIPVIPILVFGCLVAIRQAVRSALSGLFALSARARKRLNRAEVSLFAVSTLLLSGLACLYMLVRFETVLKRFAQEVTGWPYRAFGASGYVLAITWVIMLLILLHPTVRSYAFAKLLSHLELRRKLISDYHLSLWLTQLFEPDRNRSCKSNTPVLLDEKPFPVVLVAAPLQTLLNDRHQPISSPQLWAGLRTPLIKALRTALAVPPLFEPTHIGFDRRSLTPPQNSQKRVTWLRARVHKWWPFKKKHEEPPSAEDSTQGMSGELEYWLDHERIRDWAGTDYAVKGLDLVDGAVVRRNPLPALFTYLRRNPALADRLVPAEGSKQATIHVVYNVPLETSAAAQRGMRHQMSDPWAKNNIVENGLTSVRLAQRRDTQLEVRQANMIARLETEVRKECGQSTGSLVTHPIFADEIAPAEEISFRNPLNPSRNEILLGVSAGCRRTLEVLYGKSIGQAINQGETMHCPALLRLIGKDWRCARDSSLPGLPEICQACTKHLAAPVQETQAGAEKNQKLPTLKGVLEKPGRLATGKPRIAFVASGGVFRGAFHIGIITAMKLCNIEPDLIVGASVGTLMGGALGATFAFDEGIPARLVDTFFRVDETVALTRTLKCAAREMGLRGRYIRLSPRAIRRLVLRGSRSDPGFAVAGAPSPLIDAISDLFMIPHERTKGIAARFIAGQVTDSAHLLLEQLRTETIRRLNIERALIGTSLLEPVARQLLGADYSRDGARQPFLDRGIAFFGMTTDLIAQTSVLLGREDHFPNAPYDYVEAALASSAFPVVFSPRQESSVFPGIGSADRLFADGGMFDNLPFFSSIDVLSRGQCSYRSEEGQGKTAEDFLGERLNKPDLLLCGALNAVPERLEEARREFDTIGAINGRAAALQDNVKIRAFEYASVRVYDQLKRFHKAQPASAKTHDLQYVDGVVNAAVLPIFPSSPHHLNGTFAFCRSMNLDPERVCTSIADGCYQTLSALAREQHKAQTSSQEELDNIHLLAAKSVSALVKEKRIPVLQRRKRQLLLTGQTCPFFKLGDDNALFRCPFAKGRSDPVNREMNAVFVACKNDHAHWTEEGEQTAGLSLT